MTGDELQDFVKTIEVTFKRIQNNVYQFPSGQQLRSDEIDELLDWERVLSAAEYDYWY